MKKILTAILCLAMALSLAACGGGSGGDTTTPTPSATQTDGNTGAENGTDASGETYTVGICQLVQHVALDAATQGFIDALTEKLGDAVSFDVQNASGDSATCSTITNGFAASGYDLIMANATASLQAAAASTNAIPILGTSITDYATALDIDDWTGTTGTNISGTSDLAPLDAQADMINELFPDAQTIGILYCSGEPNSLYQATVITQYLEAYGYTVNAYTFADSNDVTSVTANACAESDVLYIPTDNTAASCTEAINNVALPAGVPIVASEVGICSGCGVATLSISYYDLGYETGLMAYEILVNGANIEEMQVRFAPNAEKLYNAAICEALGIEVTDEYSPIEG